MAKKTNLIWLRQTDSTNNRALEGAEKFPDTTTWVADFQTAGRGQRGNKWTSNRAENLTFSILFKPDGICAVDQFIISELSAVGVCRYLAGRGLHAKIKWPNDIYINDLKICGMLIEHGVTGGMLSYSVSGIGININQSDFPADIPNPTSLRQETGKEYNREREMESLLEEIINCYKETMREYKESGAAQSVEGEYLNLLYRREGYHKFIDVAENKEITAKIIGIDRSACLLLQTKDGERKSYAFKEVAYVL